MWWQGRYTNGSSWTPCWTSILACRHGILLFSGAFLEREKADHRHGEDFCPQASCRSPDRGSKDGSHTETTRKAHLGCTNGHEDEQTYVQVERVKYRTRNGLLPPWFHLGPCRRKEVRTSGKTGSKKGGRRRANEETAPSGSDEPSPRRFISNVPRSAASPSFLFLFFFQSPRTNVEILVPRLVETGSFEEGSRRRPLLHRLPIDLHGRDVERGKTVEKEKERESTT